MNTFGHNFRVTIFGTTHSKQIGIVIDGVPAGIKITNEDFVTDITRRNPILIGTTARKEIDEVHILSGIFNEITTGGTITLMVENKDINETNYDRKFRPSHSDFVTNKKYNGFNDFRSGGMSSGRMTVALVLAGVVAKKTLKDKNIIFTTKIINIGGIANSTDILTDNNFLSNNIINLIKITKEKGDSLGGIIECKIKNIEIGLGEPFFNSIESVLSHIIFSIPGIVGIEFGDGFNIANKKGSEVNDVFINAEGKTATNHFGGINGGISNGNEIIFRVAVRPPASIQLPQITFDFEKNEMKEQIIEGRNDTCFAVRVPVIIEAVSAIALCDFYLWFYIN